MSDESDSDPASGLDLKSVTKNFATDRATNSIKIRRSMLGHLSKYGTDSDVSSPSSQEDQLAVIANIAQTKFSPEIIQYNFETGNADLTQFTCDLALFMKMHPDVSIITDPEQVELIVNALGYFSDSVGVSNFLYLIIILSAKFDNEIVDNGFFFLVRDETFQNFPMEVLEFYQTISLESKYCHNAILCTGVLYDIVSLYQSTSEEKIVIQAAKTFETVMSISTNEDADSIRDLIPDTVNMLSNPCAEAVTNILHAIVDMLRISTSFITVFFGAKLHEIIAQLMPMPQLSKPCLDILGSMCVCSDKQFPLLFPLVEIACQLIGGDFTGDVYWTLMNALDSCPIMILPFIDNNFMTNTAQILNNSAYSVMREVACFVATLLVVAPIPELKNILSHNIILPIIDMLDCGEPPLILRCLDGLKKVVMAAYTDPSIVDSTPDLFQSDELEEALERLHEIEDPRINSRAMQLFSEIETLKKSN